MRLESLTITGVGPFTDTVTIPFRDLPSGLIAVTGRNGAGKTFTMEAALAALYRRFPSRERAVYDYATRADASIETTFALDGRGLYRARLALDGPHRKAEATLSQLTDNGQAVILNDGKVSSYERVIEELLPPLDSLLASVVAAQTKTGSFTERDRKGRRELFAELLGLKHYAEMADRCRRALARIEDDLAALAAKRDGLALIAGDEIGTALHERAQQLQVDGLTAEERRTTLRRSLADAEAALEQWRDLAQTHAEARAQRDQIIVERDAKQAELAALDLAEAKAQRDADAERDRAKVARDTALARLDREADDTRASHKELQQIAASRDAVIKDAQERIANNQDLIARAETIRAAATAIQRIEETLAATRARKAELQEQIDALLDAHRTAEAERVAADEVVAGLRRAERAAATLANVPCGGAGDYASCAFLRDAKAAEARLSSLSAAVDTAKAVADRLDDLTRAYEQLKTEQSHRTSAERQLVTEQATFKADAALLPRLTDAEARIATYTEKIAELTATTAAALAAAEVREQERQARIALDRTAREREYQAAVDDSLARCINELDGLRAQRPVIGQVVEHLTLRIALLDEAMRSTHEAADQAETAERTLKALQQQLAPAEAAVATVQAQVTDLEARRAEYLAHRTTLEAVRERISHVQQESAEWGVLLKAVAPDGLPTLEIDHAGPAVTAFANDLLQVIYGGAFSMELVTQVPRTSKGKDGATMKEVFELLIYDQRRGGEARTLEDLSGGERVIVEEVLRSAIALLVNTRNAQPIHTAWRDETTGALDPENAARYIAMLRRVQQIGGFHQILFVTHNPDCALLADAQIRVGGGTVVIVEPPYSPSAGEPMESLAAA